MAISKGEKTIHLLLVEDELKTANEVAQIVANLNFSSGVGIDIILETVGSLSQARSHLASYVVDVVLLDLSLPDSQGIGVIQDLAHEYPFIPIIVLTNVNNWSSMIRSVEAGGRDFLIKNELEQESLFRAVYHAFEKKELERQLRQVKERHDSFVEQLPVGTFQKDIYGRYLAVNPEFCRLVEYGSDDILRHNDNEIFTGHSARELIYLDQEVKNGREMAELETELKTAAGTVIKAYVVKIPILDDYREVTGIHGFLQDVSQIKEAKTKQHLFDRFESMESLTKEVVARARDQLTPIALNASLIDADPQAVATKDLCQKIVQAASKSGQTLQHLVTFTENGKTKSLSVDVEFVFSEVKRFAEKHITEAVRIITAVEPELPAARADFPTLLKILQQLCKNSWEAISGAGTITMTAEKIAHSLQQSTASPSNHALLIRVKDTGSGISSAIRNQIFNPYFTTKNPEQFMGMGLANALKMINELGGTLRLDPDHTPGACFEVVLPAEGIPSGEANDQSSPGRELTLLVVDDNEEIVAATQQFLECKGFKVIMARNGFEAVARFAENAHAIDLVMTDLDMSQLDGVALATAIRQHSPSKPILVTTGLSQKETTERLGSVSVQAIIPKPFAPKKLLRIILEHCKPPANR